MNLRPERRAAWSLRSTRDSSAALADNAGWLAMRVVKVRTRDDKNEDPRGKDRADLYDLNRILPVNAGPL